MKKPINPQMAELGPFYQLCWLGLLATLSNLLFMLWNASIRHGQLVAATLTSSGLVLFIVTYRVIRLRQRRAQEARMSRGVATERPRLKLKLDELRGKLRQFSGTPSALLVLVPESTVVLSTLRSNPEPVVEMTVGFWSTYGHEPHLVEAAVAHEAGHIAARDVELFLRMLSLMRALAWFMLPMVTVCVVLFWGRGQVPAVSIGYFLCFSLVSALGLALAWSALLVAREIQADAFAVQVLGSPQPVRELLEGQFRLRAAGTHERRLLQRLRTWLIQPELRWRASLPFMRGSMGAWVGIKLGVATGAFAETLLWSVSFVSLSMGGDSRFYFSWFLALFWCSWLAYRFFWGRSRAMGGRQLRALALGLRDLVCFCLPGQVFMLGSHLIRLRVTGQASRTLGFGGLAETILALSALPTVALVLWGMSKLTLVSPKERHRGRPSIVRALLALVPVRGSAS